MEADAKWIAVDAYVCEALTLSDAALDAALAANREAELPAIDVSAAQGKMLQLMAEMCGARRVLEIGTLGGYSTIWLARAVGQQGKVVSLELNAKHVQVARANVERAGLAEVVKIREGAALESLRRMVEAGEAAFDFVFIDADKQNGAAYLEWSLKLARVGTVIVVDNVVRDGAVANAASDDPYVVGSRKVIAAMAASERLEATVVQTVGSKGYDGFAVARVVG